MKKRVIVSVINDLYTDQRVHKTCETLVELGFDVILVGRKKRKSPALSPRNYVTKRMKLLFETGPLFYAEFNFRLFLFLCFHRCSLMVANDLDTLLANYLAKLLFKRHLIYDSHEYFTGVPELANNHFKRKTWKAIEKWIFPKLHDIITVNQSIAQLYENEYRKKLHIVRNIPAKINYSNLKTRTELGLPENKFILILQGSGINLDRGTEEAVLAMQYVENAVLCIVGDGDVLPILKKLTIEHNLVEKILFIGKKPYEEMMQYTRNANLGLTLDKDTNINYRFSLPNKLFDYIHANIPVLASPLVEIKKIIDEYNIGTCIESHDINHIAKVINNIIQNPLQIKVWKENCNIAAQNLNWEKEKNVLIHVFRKYC